MLKILKIRLLLLPVFTGFSFYLAGQDLDPSDFSIPAFNLNTWNGNQSSSVYLTQIGNTNKSDVIQQGGASATAPNLVRNLQIGDLNTIQVLHQGSNLRTDVFQYGVANTVLSDVQGSNLESTLIQNGTNNFITQKISNSTLIQTEFQQNGNFNRIEQVVDGKSALPVKLIQNGNNLTAIVNQTNL